jgi:hypothetical protein
MQSKVTSFLNLSSFGGATVVIFADPLPGKIMIITPFYL